MERFGKMRLFRTTVLTVIFLVTVACARKPETPTLQKVKFVVPPYQDSLVVTFGKEKGWYKAEGLDVEFLVVGLDEVQEAIASGSVDVGWSTTTNTMVASVRNPNVVFVYPWNTFDQGFALIARPNGSIKPVEAFLTNQQDRPTAIRAAARQLKGKTVVTTSHTDMEQAVASLAERGGLSFGSDLHIINLPPDEGLAAFLSGTGDAYMGGIPQRTRAVKEGMVEVVRGLDLGPAPINGLISSKAYVQSHKETVLKLLKVWFEIDNYINDHEEEAGAFISRDLNKRTGCTVCCCRF